MTLRPTVTGLKLYSPPAKGVEEEGLYTAGAPRYHAFGLIGTALSKKISVFQSSSLKVVPISPNVS